MSEFGRLLEWFLSGHLLRKIGLILGLLLGLSIVTFGFFSTLVIIFCMFLGWFLGRVLEDNPYEIDSLKLKFHKKQS